MQIDRRDALKKLAVGGVTAATTSAVISSPVFADDTPIPPAQPIIVDASVDPETPATLNVTLGPGAATCNGSASGVARVDRSVLVAVGDPATTVEADPELSPVLFGDGTLSAMFTIIGSGPGEAVLNYRVVYQCTYATGVTELCARRLVRFQTDGSNWSTTPGFDSDLLLC